MTSRTRNFVFGSALVLVVGLATGLVAMYNGNPLRSGSAGPEDLAYLPSDVVAVAYADVAGVMNSEFSQKIRQMLPTGEEKERLANEIGVDLEHDVDTVLAGLSASPTTGLSENGAVVLIRGRFNNGRIEAIALQHGATAQEYKGKRLIVSPEIPHPQVLAPGAATVQSASTTASLAFLEPGLIALGTTSAIKRGIDAAETGENVTKSTELMKFVADLDRSSTTWAVGRFDALAQSSMMPQQVKDQLPPVQWFVVSAQIDGGVSGVVRAETRDEQSANNLRDVVRGGLAAAHLVAGNNPQLDTMVNSVQVSGTGKMVAVSFRITPQMLDVVIGMAGLAHQPGAVHDVPKAEAPKEIHK